MRRSLKFCMGLLLIALFQLFVSCTKNEMSLEVLTAFVKDKDNHLLQTTERCGTNFKVAYRPTDFLVEQETGGIVVSDSIVSACRSKFGKYHYFILSVANSDKDFLQGYSEGPDEFSENLRKISFDLYRYVYLVGDNNDTIALADFNTPRYFGVAKQTDILLAFERPQENYRSLELVVEDFGFNCGRIKFEYASEDLLNAPQLKFN